MSCLRQFSHDGIKLKLELEQKQKRRKDAPLLFEQIVRKNSGIIGRGGGIRTRDPLHPMQVRYQAALYTEN